jgi:hypothetical protein
MFIRDMRYMKSEVVEGVDVKQGSPGSRERGWEQCWRVCLCIMSDLGHTDAAGPEQCYYCRGLLQYRDKGEYKETKGGYRRAYILTTRPPSHGSRSPRPEGLA